MKERVCRQWILTTSSSSVAGPGGYVCADPRRAARAQNRGRREERHPRRHLSQCRLHPVQGDAARLGTVRGGRPQLRADGHQGRQAERRSCRRCSNTRNRTSTATSKASSILFKKNKIEAFHGTGQHRRARQGRGEGRQPARRRRSKTKNIVIATGSDVARLSGIDIDEKRVVSSTGALDLTKVPQKLLVVGAGIIGLELGSVWRRLGAQVTVVEFLDHILPGIDGEVARQFQRLLEKQGIAFKLSSKVTGVDTSGKDAQGEGRAGGAAAPPKRSRPTSFWSRSAACPYTEGLGLEAVGVKKDNRGRVIVDPHFRTNVAGIYAIGDAIAGPMLAHKAEDEGVAAAEIIAGQAGHVNYDVIPNVVYTHPGDRFGRQNRGRAEGGRRRLSGRQISVLRQRPRAGKPGDRRLRQNSRRRQDRPRARRAYSRPRRRNHDRRGRDGDGVRRLVGRHRAHLSRPSDAERGDEGSGPRGGQARALHLVFACFYVARLIPRLRHLHWPPNLLWFRMTARQHWPVIVSARDPTGLTLACLLARYGVDVLVIERNPQHRAGAARGIDRRRIAAHHAVGWHHQRTRAADRSRIRLGVFLAEPPAIPQGQADYTGIRLSTPQRVPPAGARTPAAGAISNSSTKSRSCSRPRWTNSRSRRMRLGARRQGRRDRRSVLRLSGRLRRQPQLVRQTLGIEMHGSTFRERWLILDMETDHGSDA